MSSSDHGAANEGRLVCGYCGKDLDLLPGSQELGHADGTDLCPEAFEEVRIMPPPERMSELEARHLLAIDRYEDRERRPVGLAASVLILGLLAAAAIGVVWAIAGIVK